VLGRCPLLDRNTGEEERGINAHETSADTVAFNIFKGIVYTITGVGTWKRKSMRSAGVQG
jgi:hypothetical protein